MLKQYNKVIDGLTVLFFENSYLLLSVLPEVGGKITSIVNKRSGREWLWQNKHAKYKKNSYGDSFIAVLDSGGFDECFPTVDPCSISYEGNSCVVPDHGEVCSREWSVESMGDGKELSLGLSIFGVIFKYKFSRKIVIGDSNEITLRYTLENLSENDIPFTWCPHPEINIEAGMKLQLPDGLGLELKSSIDDFMGCDGDRGNWPNWNLTNGDIVDLSKIPDFKDSDFQKMAGKFYTDELSYGQVSIVSPGGDESLMFQFDSDIIKNVSLWMNYMAWHGIGNEDYYNLVIEPVIGPYDSLEKAIASGSCPICPPLSKLSWDLKLTIN